MSRLWWYLITSFRVMTLPRMARTHARTQRRASKTREVWIRSSGQTDVPFPTLIVNCNYEKRHCWGKLGVGDAETSRAFLHGPDVPCRPPNSHVHELRLSMMGFAGGAFGRRLGLDEVTKVAMKCPRQDECPQKQRRQSSLSLPFAFSCFHSPKDTISRGKR